MPVVSRIALLLGFALIASSCGDSAVEDAAASTREVASRILFSIQGNEPEQVVTPDNIASWLVEVSQDVQEFWRGSSDETVWRANLAVLEPGETRPGRCTFVNDDGEREQRVYNSWSRAYCPADDTIYLGADAMFEVYRDDPRTGDFAAAIVIAHEAGHNFQSDIRLPRSAERPELRELQADCFAGAWAQWMDASGKLEEGDIEAALAATAKAGSFDFASPKHHGTPDQRKEAFMLGYTARNAGLECFVYTPGRR